MEEKRENVWIGDRFTNFLADKIPKIVILIKDIIDNYIEYYLGFYIYISDLVKTQPSCFSL